MISEDRHRAIFGPREHREPGRWRACKSCGGEHRLDQAWPHNCRPPAPPRARHLTTPQIAPAFQPFRAHVTEGPVINTRAEKADFMARNGLAEYDPGIRRQGTHWTEQRADADALGQMMADFSETDTEYLSNMVGFDVTNPERVDDTGSLEEGTEISTDDIEVIDAKATG